MFSSATKRVTPDAAGCGLQAQDVSAEKDFSSHRLDDGRLVDPLEDEWQALEDVALPVVRSWLRGNEEPHVQQELVTLAAIHFARSFGFRQIYENVRRMQIEAAAETGERGRMIRLFRNQYGRSPIPGEIADLVREFHEGYFGADGPARIEGMIEMHNRAIDTLARSDSAALSPLWEPWPSVHSRRHSIRALLQGSARHSGRDREGLAVGNAETLFMPISPDVAVEFVSEAMDPGFVAPLDVQKLNSLTWRAAFSQVLAHPSADLARCLGTRLDEASEHPHSALGPDLTPTPSNLLEHIRETEAIRKERLSTPVPGAASGASRSNERFYLGIADVTQIHRLADQWLVQRPC